MNKIITFIWTFLFLCFNGPLWSQPDVIWTRTYGGNSGETGFSVQQTNDGGYIICGVTYSYGAGGADIWLVKTDANGDTLWTKTIGEDGDEQAQDIRQTVDGGFIICAITGSFSFEAQKIWLLKTDAHGDTIWTKTFGGNSYDGGYSVEQTEDGGYMMIGHIWSYNGTRYDVWLTKTDSLGNVMSNVTFGGFNDDVGKSLQSTFDGGYIITGTLDGDVLLAKAGADGDTLWTKLIGGSSGDGGNFVQQTADSGYIVTGFTYSYGKGANDIWLIKTDINGDTLWTRTYGGNYNDNGFCVRQTNDNGYIICGVSNSFSIDNSDIWVIKTNALGDTLWTKVIGGSSPDYGYSVLQNSTGEYILTGETASDMLLINLSPVSSAQGKKNKDMAIDFNLYQNYPNPFNPSTTIEFTLPKSEFVELKVYNILGKEVSILVSNKLNQGNHTYQFEGKNLASGIYYYQLTAGDYRQVKKMILIK